MLNDFYHWLLGESAIFPSKTGNQPRPVNVYGFQANSPEEMRLLMKGYQKVKPMLDQAVRTHNPRFGGDGKQFMDLFMRDDKYQEMFKRMLLGYEQISQQEVDAAVKFMSDGR